jgi:mRNA interferase RelE/StbE
MVKYRIRSRISLEKALKYISEKDRIRIAKRLRSLENNPRPYGCERLIGQNKYRIRQGVYRIMYEINDDEHIVTVIKVAHRKDIYRAAEEKADYDAGEAPRK